MDYESPVSEVISIALENNVMSEKGGTEKRGTVINGTEPVEYEDL